MTDPRKKTELESLFRSGKIGRRAFMQGVSALGLSSAFASSVISDVQAATPKQGGSARLGLGHGGTTDSLDPATFEDGYMLLTPPSRPHPSGTEHRELKWQRVS